MTTSLMIFRTNVLSLFSQPLLKIVGIENSLSIIINGHKEGVRHIDKETS